VRLVSRSVLREIWPPFLLGFAAYTFILLIRTILFLADFAVRRSAPFAEVARLVVLSLPWIVVLTLPMAFLLGVLIGMGRLASDSELTALRSCGVGPGALYRPVLGAAVGLSIGVLVIYTVLLPPANVALERSMARVAATSIVNVVAPRTFREPRPGILFFFDRVAPDGRSFDGVFLKLGDEPEPPNRVIVARNGSLTLEGDRLWLDLHGSVVHEVDPEDPSRYRTSRNASQRLLLAGDLGNAPGARVTTEPGVRSQTLSELWRTARREPASSPRARLAWVEIHKKFAVSFACLAFALVGVPFSESLRRGGRGSGFAVSLLVIVVYYVLLTSGETWAQEGRLSPAVAMWLPNGALLVVGVLAALRRPAVARPVRRLPETPVEEVSREAAPASRSPASSRLLSLLDRYVLARFGLALLLVLASALVLSVVVDYADKLDKIARNHPPREAVLGYYRYFLISISLQIAPFATLLATLVGLGTLSRTNEDTAFRASGVSLRRVALPAFLLAGAAGVVSFAVGEYIQPFAEQRQARYKNVIYGRAPDTGIRTAAERNWYLASDGATIWHREEGDATRSILYGVSIFSFDRDFNLTKRIGARQAAWEEGRWVLRQGWIREFSEPEQPRYGTFLTERVPGDAPTSLAPGRRPEEMRFRELERLTRRLRRSGYTTASLETALQSKLAQPAMLPVMALLAIPFAFRIGRRGTLAGIGLGLFLGILALIAAAFLTKLGEVGALPPVLAAWSPNVFFGLAATYLLLRMPT